MLFRSDPSKVISLFLQESTDGGRWHLEVRDVAGYVYWAFDTMASAEDAMAKIRAAKERTLA